MHLVQPIAVLLVAWCHGNGYGCAIGVSAGVAGRVTSAVVVTIIVMVAVTLIVTQFGFILLFHFTQASYDSGSKPLRLGRQGHDYRWCNSYGCA